jgi:hypothetical protein
MNIRDDRAPVWEGLSLLQRLLGSEMLLVFGDFGFVFWSGDWRHLVCRVLAVSGPDCAAVSQALDGMHAAGVIGSSQKPEPGFWLLYSQKAFNAHRGLAHEPPSPRLTSPGGVS